MNKRVINTQGREKIAFLRSEVLPAGNSFTTLAKIPGLLRSTAGLMLKPALRPDQAFIPNERRDRLSAQRLFSVLFKARGLALSSKVSTEPPVPGTVSLFN